MKRVIINAPGNWSKWPQEFKDKLAALKDNRQVGEKLVFENNEIKIWSIHLPPGESLPFHKHIYPYFWTILSEGKARSHYNDGKIVETEYEVGDTKYFNNLSKDNYFIHTLENIGDTMLIFTTVEFIR